MNQRIKRLLKDFRVVSINVAMEGSGADKFELVTSYYLENKYIEGNCLTFEIPEIERLKRVCAPRTFKRMAELLEVLEDKFATEK